MPTGAVLIVDVSTHSRLKAAGSRNPAHIGCKFVSTHSRLKAAGKDNQLTNVVFLFQHTAA